MIEPDQLIQTPLSWRCTETETSKGLIGRTIPVKGRCRRVLTHMVGGAMLPIQRLGDEHLPEHGVDIEHLVGRLISADARDAVADRDVLILVRADLNKNKQKSKRLMTSSVNAPVKGARNRVAQRASRLYFFQTFSP